MSNNKQISLVKTCFITTGKMDANAAEVNGKYPYFTCAPTPLRINSFAFDDNAILLAGNNAGGNFHCQRYSGKFNAYQRTYVITAKDGYDIDYIYYTLLINLKRFKVVSQGSQTKFLTMQILNQFTIDDISLVQQKKIVSVLKNIDKKIENNNAISSQLESLAKTIYDYWFLQFDFPDENGNPYRSSGGKMVWNDELKREIPEGWEVKNLHGLFDEQRGISYTSENIKSGTGMPMINLACIDTNRKYRDGKLKYYEGDIKNKIVLHGGELLVACTDLTRNADIIGCPVFTPEDGREYLYTMDLVQILPDKKYFDELYFGKMLQTSHYHNYIKKWASGTNVLHLNLDGMKWYKTCIPPLSLQKKFGKIIKSINKKESLILAENRQLTSLRDFLLPLLMNGQVTFKEG